MAYIFGFIQAKTFCKLNFWYILLFTVSCKAHKQIDPTLDGKWYIELNHNDIGFARTIMTFDTNGKTFKAYTRKNADKDILGGFTSLLGRTFTSSFKEGKLLRIEEGIFIKENDTLKFAGILTSAVGRSNIQGYVANKQLYGRISNKKGDKGELKGYRKDIALPLEDYSSIFDTVVTVTENNIYSKKLLDTKEWKNFKNDMKEVSGKVQDDLEMLFAFYYYAGKLPVSHYSLMTSSEMPTKTLSKETLVKRVFLEEKKRGTAYFKVTSFDGTAAEMDSIFNIIRHKAYSNLIVDLRDNPGGSIEAGMAFATNIAKDSFYGGIFLTQKYFSSHVKLPSVEQFKNFPEFTESNYGLLLDGIHSTEGLCLKVIPKTNAYEGNVYILTNSNTASTCEPIVYGFKHQGRATIIGEKTAGAMLNGEMFNLNKGFRLFLPTADYYTADGYRIDQNGVKPHIEVKQEEALDYVLTNLIP